MKTVLETRAGQRLAFTAQVSAFGGRPRQAKELYHSVPTTCFPRTERLLLAENEIAISDSLAGPGAVVSLMAAANVLNGFLFQIGQLDLLLLLNRPGLASSPQTLPELLLRQHGIENQDI